MAVTYGFYNALNHDRLYDAIQMSSIFDGIIRDGIFSTIGDHMVVSAPEDGWYVNVGSGRAWFNHTWTLNDTDYPIEPEEAEVVLDRIDAVILEVNAGAEVRANSIKFLKGTPSSEPVKPTLTHNAEVNQYALAYVRIRAGQTTIFQTDVENAIGTDETPFITGLLQQVSIETLLTQWEAEFNTYFTNFQSTSTTEFNNWLASKVAEYTLWYAQMQTDMDADFAEFDAWFQRMKDQLSEDAAGHLQAEIDELAEAAKKGSIVTVTTTDPTLFNRPVTISQTGFDPVTSSFNASGVAYFETVPMVGDVAIEATNGTLTAHGILNIPYFGRYNTTLEFWTATLNMSTDFPTLYNRQITISSGQITVGTTTFDSTGHATFDVHSAGTYHISATDSSSIEYTADVTVTEETIYNIEVPDVPDGSIVEPINSIPIWLKCANLNKSYTTLAEVLADTETYETLLADSNACQYMKRSTSWAVATGLVPTMTDNTHPSGVASASSVYNNMADYQPWKAFNGDYNTFWAGNTVGTTGSGTITYMFPNAVVVKRARIVTRERGTLTIDTASIQGSNDGSTWSNDLWSFTNEDNIDCTAILNNNTAYSYYRLTIKTNSTSSNVAHPGIGLIQYYASSDASIVDDQDAMARLGKFDYASNLLLSDSTWAEAIFKSDYWESVCINSVPKMTSNTTPSGSVGGSGAFNSSYPAWYSFDRNDSTSSALSTASYTAWIQYDFGYSNHVYGFCALFTTGGSGEAMELEIKYSDDNSTFESAGTYRYEASDNNSTKYYKLNADYGSHRYWRMVRTLDNHSVSWSSTGNTVQFYGREKTVQYRATVPTMTSATTPSGVASDSGHYDYYDQYSGWHVFDGTTANYLSPQNSVNQWIAYTFPEAKTIKKMTIYGAPKANNESVSSVIKTQVKVNDSWIDLDTYNNSSTTLNATRYFENQYSSTDYRILFSGMVESKSFVTIWNLQFYEEVTGDVILHSAANDTIYCIDENDNQMPICTTDEKGVGKCDLSSFQAGPVTLYSSVAKNPEDLPADYSKTITITKTQYGGTTEAYLIPDTIKTLYWWGFNNSTNPVVDMKDNGWSTNKTWATTEFNTNDISINVGGSNYVKGVASINKVKPTKVYSVSVSTYTQRIWGISKQKINQSEYFTYVEIPTTLGKTEVTPVDTDDYYVGCYATSGSNITIKAFWYE